MTGIFKFLGRSHDGLLSRLPKEQRDKIERNAERAAEELKEHGDGPTEVDDIRRREREPAET